MAKISVIVPVYNPNGEYLKKCINSIQNQTFQDIEIILIDNQSTNDNSQILQEYASKDNRIKLIVKDRNEGFAGAVNEGIKKSTGDFLSIIDSDDWLENNALQTLYNKLNNSDLDMTIYCANTFDERTQKFSNEIIYTFCEIPPKFDNSYFTFDDIKHNILYYPTQAWNKFYRRSFIIRNNNFIDEQLGSAGADALFTFYNYINAKKIGIVRDRLYNYRTNVSAGVVSSLSQRDCKDFLFPFVLHFKINNLIKEKSLQSDLAFPFIEVNIQMLLYFFNLIHKDNRRVFYNKLHECLNSLDKSIYTDAQINKFSKVLKHKFKRIQNNGFFNFTVKNFFFKLENYLNGRKYCFFGVSVYKVHFEDAFKIKNILNLIKIRKRIGGSNG